MKKDKEEIDGLFLTCLGAFSVITVLTIINKPSFPPFMWFLFGGAWISLLAVGLAKLSKALGGKG